MDVARKVFHFCTSVDVGICSWAWLWPGIMRSTKDTQRLQWAGSYILFLTSILPPHCALTIANPLPDVGRLSSMIGWPDPSGEAEATLAARVKQFQVLVKEVTRVSNSSQHLSGKGTSSLQQVKELSSPFLQAFRTALKISSAMTGFIISPV